MDHAVRMSQLRVRRSVPILRVASWAIAVVLVAQIAALLYTCTYRQELATLKLGAGAFALIYFVLFYLTFSALCFQRASCARHSEAAGGPVCQDYVAFTERCCFHFFFLFVFQFMLLGYGNDGTHKGESRLYIHYWYWSTSMILSFLANTLVVGSHWLAEAYPDTQLSNRLPSTRKIRDFPGKVAKVFFARAKTMETLKDQCPTEQSTEMAEEVKSLGARMDRLAKVVDGMAKALHFRGHYTSNDIPY